MTADANPSVGCLGLLLRFGAPIGLLLADLCVLGTALLPELVTVLVMGTLGLAIIPLLVLPNLVLYAHGPVVMGAMRAFGAPWHFVLAAGLAVFLSTALVPPVASGLAHTVSESMASAPGSLGSAPMDAPRTLRLERTEQRASGKIIGPQGCDEICLQLLLGGEVDAIEVSYAGSTPTVYRRVDQPVCPVWQHERLPAELERWHAKGQCIVAEPGATLPGAPRVAWERGLLPVLPWSVPRFFVTIEGGPSGAATWRVRANDRLPIGAPAAFFIVGAKQHDRTALGFWRRTTRVPELTQMLRQTLGYRLDPLPAAPRAEAPPTAGAPPEVSPFWRIKHNLAIAGELGRNPQREIGSLLQTCRDCEVDPDVLAEVLSDPRLRYEAYSGLVGLARSQPDALAPHVERLLELAEDTDLEPRDRGAITDTLAHLPLPLIVPHAQRLMVLAGPDPDDKYSSIRKRLLPIIGRLGIDPTSVLRDALAGDEDLLDKAGPGYCNTDPQWAAPLLDDAEAALFRAERRGAQESLSRSLVRHGRAEAVERFLTTVVDRRANEIRDALARTVNDPPGGCQW